ncbi:hypothetical protein AMV189 [Betaentomopoxvirus amoorei]|uniref:AMV189 n=1 Tax=Amsacta moorei entomopoxvirus TaxID=28321 RepID=Q9EML6_AMEPV|nr:hypothetical protein AMV189 [Amsacta moorei entomopoxvirus]AAG02895.1 AMV189 [Amsacta moorei entomopoxvirus]
MILDICDVHIQDHIKDLYLPSNDIFVRKEIHFHRNLQKFLQFYVNPLFYIHIWILIHYYY